VIISYRGAARDDFVRQFRYYLVTLNLPEVATRFRDAVRQTVRSLRQQLLVGQQYHSDNTQLQSLRVWSVTGFEMIRIYYIPEENVIRVIRILHGRRDVKRILEREAGI